MQREILGCLGHLLFHEQAREQLVIAAPSWGSGFFCVLITLLRRESLGSPTLASLLGALAALGSSCDLHLAATLTRASGYGKMLMRMLCFARSTSKAALVATLDCVVNAARTVLQLDDDELSTAMLCFVKPMLKLLSNSSTTVQRSTLMAIDQIASLGEEQRRWIVMETNTLNEIGPLGNSPSEKVVMQSVKVLHTLSKGSNTGGRLVRCPLKHDLDLSPSYILGPLRRCT